MRQRWPCGQNMILRIDCVCASYLNHRWAPWPFICVPGVTSDSCSCSLWEPWLEKEKWIRRGAVRLDIYETAGKSTFSGCQRNNSRHRFVFCAFVGSLFCSSASTILCDCLRNLHLNWCINGLLWQNNSQNYQIAFALLLGS